MAGSFETSDGERSLDLRPVRVAQRFEEVWSEAFDLASELPRWRVIEADETRRVLVCECEGGFLAPSSRITLRFESPEGIPSTTVTVRAESTGGLPGLSRDRARVREFMRRFQRRVG